MSDRPVFPPPGSSSSSKKKNPRRSRSKKSGKPIFQKSCRFNPEVCNHKNTDSKADCWRYNESVSPHVLHRQAQKAAKKPRVDVGVWEPKAPKPVQKLDSPISPISPTANISSVSPIPPVPSANQLDTNETVKTINIIIYTLFNGKVDEHGVPITREWYAKLVLDPNFEIKRTNPTMVRAPEKALIPKNNGTIEVSMSMAPNKEPPAKQSQKGRKKPNN
ncbi:hypothetical protein M3Y98_00081900 [Aphelenchoides besseyi]|nr:hypothetical protein M3Y98_00081900 [Aphelenchoides besseyi]KAI6198643.1 hypothetical protein M3Y96_00541000 [Aphelenchoides besseyi]